MSLKLHLGRLNWASQAVHGAMDTRTTISKSPSKTHLAMQHNTNLTLVLRAVVAI